MKTLHLILKGKWFDMIFSGEKKEDYREQKPYWFRRLMNDINSQEEFKKFDHVICYHGYQKNRRKFKIEFDGIKIDTGWTMWGAERGREYFVIMFGEIIK